ncbi:ATP synthase subunit I [Bacillus benzoevorans]|uniref:ATP synthase protein I n=1 Tax=Bacillus benzoevorans TaxID=1456 RepID=A0A7X0LY64_9BACI|nr:ATP synthase subunit I [Bacillus benzoevorans]MBB6447177.1 ATP synthase protein I [Bacillus benzoevorans]
MTELSEVYARQRKYIFFILAILVLGWGFTDYQTIFLGLILGTAISLFNLWNLARRTEKFGEAVVKGGRKKRSLGMFTRMAASIAGVIIAMEFPEYFHVLSVVIGLMAAYIVIMIDSFLQLFNVHK